ncbi:unnamed protein product [Didymodactylos carnosus]|uniref:Uncharacterized protein n=1 Tax=Didymodactylos carnosus TaxID=1234261 RepID=A0A8S2RI47_9BILA|nr:unnamed protein product [Didymodactylos carnosus]CAF4169743.1 unnamed protein product [Didymodactylos carnosus]
MTKIWFRTITAATALVSHSVTFSDIQLLLTNLPQLKHLMCACYVTGCADGREWAKLLSTLSLLTKFQLLIDSERVDETVDDLVHSWTDNKWNIQVEYNNKYFYAYTLPFIDSRWFSTYLYDMKTSRLEGQRSNSFDVQYLYITVTNKDNDIPKRYYSNVYSLLIRPKSQSLLLPTFLDDISKMVQLSSVQEIGEKKYGMMSGQTRVFLVKN